MTTTIYTQQTQKKNPTITYSVGLRKMFAAALVSRQFCQHLLKEPTDALKHGYMGEVFNITEEERNLIVSTRANSLAELALHVNEALELNHEQKTDFRSEVSFGRIQYPRTTYSTE
jgi:hypothetical protein